MTDVGDRVREHLAEHPLTKEHLEEHGTDLKNRLAEKPRRFVSEKFEELKSSTETQVQLGQQSTVREFVVHAIDVDYAMNSFGLHNPRGVMYVLTENRQAARDASGQPLGDGFDLLDEGTTAGSDVSILQPLTIRANQGDTIKVTFINELDDRASMHVAGLSYDVNTSDGMNVGNNPDTTAAPISTELDSDFDGTTDPIPDGAVEYTWQADIEGTHFIIDGANQAVESNPTPPPEGNFALRGLFGAVVVERAGSTWTDPNTGEPIRSGVKADVHTPGFPDHREFIIFYHNAEGARTDDGSILTYPDGTEQAVHALNYRSDPTGSRIQPRPGAEDSTDPDTFYSSWVHGDPGGGDLVFPGYVGDPIKMVGVGASIEENHVHHFHNHRWTQAPQLPRNDDTRDSEAIGLGSAVESYIVVGHGEGTTRPGMNMEEAFDIGLGQEHGGVGDILVHCHLFPHYGEGMTGFVRSHNETHEDLVVLPNNTPAQNDRLITDPAVPTFPEFVPGEKGARPPQPPSALGRDPEPLEEEVMGPEPTPGAPFSDPCPDPLPGTTREYTIVATGADIVYNDAGEHDPEGICFVLEEDAAAVQSGEMDPEPLVIRANVGDCVEITLRNELPDDKFPVGSTVSNHPHFVAFDPLGSDSTMTGYNYNEAAIKGENGDETHYRWYADEEGTIYFHDHMHGIEEGMHGVFASIIIEPINSTWRDPYNGEEIESGTQAIIEDPNGEDFREQVLIIHDFAPLKKRNSDEFVNPDREHGVNAGMMAINFRNAPYYRRNDPDPAYVHSSAVHGDPETPVFETYAGDPIRIRLLQGAYEEQHNLGTNGLRLDPVGLETEDTVTQLIGASEGFTLRAGELTNFERINNFEGLPVWDHLIGSNIMDDLWSGMWGLHRVWNAEVSHLQPLPGRGAPSESLVGCEKVLRRMGIPAAFDDRATEGQKARLTYDPDDDRSYPPDKDARKNAFVGEIPPKAPVPGDPCPPDTPVREVNVTAFQTDIQFNEYGDHDPYGIVFALDAYVDDIRDGSRPPEPLAIRMREGECMELTLTNALPETPNEDHADPEMPNEQPWRRSNRVSLHPQRMSYDDQGSDGATIGFNFDQTIAPGESITYRWYADETLGNCVLWDMADLRGNRHHGAVGHLIVEPPGATWLDPETAEPLPSGTDAIVSTPEGDDFREYTLSMSDGRYIVNPDGTCVVPPGPPEPGEPDNSDDPCNQIGDDEEKHGYVSINNRAEPFFRRFQRGSDEPYLVYDSEVHGDPATPISLAFVGDPVRFRVANTADKADGIAFHLAGHQFPRFTDRPRGGSVGVDDDFSTGKAKTLVPTDGAGGPLGVTGDFIYQETKQIRRLEAGFWGIFRVIDPPSAGGAASSVDAPGFASIDAPDPEQLEPVAQQEAPPDDPPIQPLPDRAGDVPLEQRPGYTVTTGDATGDGTQDVLVGVPGSDIGGAEAGAAYLFVDTDPSEITDLAGANAQFLGTEPGMQAGQNVAIGGPSTADAAGGGNALGIGTASGTETVSGGQSLQNLIENPPETEIGETVQNTTEGGTEATVPLGAANGGTGA